MVYVIIGALLIGLTLGIMGSGGSILTVPLLVYLLGHQDKVAIAESLAIVGGIALIAVIPYARTKRVDWPSVLFFGIPGMLGTYSGAWLAHYVDGKYQLLLFAVVMLAAAWSMLRRSRSPAPVTDSDGTPGPGEPERDEADGGRGSPQAVWLIGLEGAAVGVVTGLVGVGGGFLVVPALVLLRKLPMRVAVGTSLAVIAMNSVVGLVKYLDVLNDLQLQVNWGTVGLFVALGVAGSLVGHQVASRLNQRALRRAFAVFLVVMGLFVLGKEGSKLVIATPVPPTATRPAHMAPAARMPPAARLVSFVRAALQAGADFPNAAIIPEELVTSIRLKEASR